MGRGGELGLGFGLGLGLEASLSWGEDASFSSVKAVNPNPNPLLEARFASVRAASKAVSLLAVGKLNYSMSYWHVEEV